MKISEIITSERGRIVPGVNTTKDVKPDQLKRQCAKLGMKCNKDGVPDDIFLNISQSMDWGVQPWVGSMVRAGD